MHTNTANQKSKRQHSRAPYPNQPSHGVDNAERRIENRRGRRGAKQFLRAVLSSLSNGAKG